jgi:pimeloyl-ACP methyl ester carboxylesterase
MPRLQRPDGTEIHWESSGEGPLVVLVSYWSMLPSVFSPLIEEIVAEHRVVLYDDRGAGRSTRTGPYDLDTAATDLRAVIEAAGAPALLVATADGANRAVRVAAEAAELVTAIVGIGGVPLGREGFRGSDSLVTSDTVIQAMLRQLETDYRGALRGLIAAGNAQMSEQELRDRVNAQAEYLSHEAAVGRMIAWTTDDPLEYSRAAGDRLWLLISERLGGDWFPSAAEAKPRLREHLPQVHIVDIDDGMISRPDQAAEVIRRITAEAREPAARD